MKTNRKGWGFPLMLGIATAMLLGLALWPEEIPTQSVVVAARDLGAGTVLQASDLRQITVDAINAPTDAAVDVGRLIGETLAVVRFANEPVTSRHIGQAVTLSPTERGIAVQVQADTGLAGLLRPGMEVGLVATMGGPLAGGEIYAKSLLEGLRVLYVPPEFQARPFAPISAQMTVANGESTAPAVSAPLPQSIRDGVIVLAASTLSQTIVYEMTQPEQVSLRLGSGQATTSGILDRDQDGVDDLVELEEGEVEEPPKMEVVPVELLAALNAVEASFTLVLMPEDAEDYTTPGFELGKMVIKPEEEDESGQ